MFKFFKLLKCHAKIGATEVPLSQPSSLSGVRTENVDNNELLDFLTLLSANNGVAVIQQAAGLAVVGELLLSLLPHLPAATRQDILRSFHKRIEGLMSLGDDRPFPEQFQSALLIEVNRYLNAIR